LIIKADTTAEETIRVGRLLEGSYLEDYR